MASSDTATETAHNDEAPTLGIPSDTDTSPPPSPPLPVNPEVGGARMIVVMGVSGTGKSTLGRALSRATHMAFIDGDDLHPAANVAKMSRGEPLGDEDRRPWLETIRQTAVACVARSTGAVSEGGRCPGVIVACSSLKRAYRARLRGEGSLPTYFVYLKGERAVLMARMVDRQGHFMKAGMLESQLDTLESPEGEPGVVTVSVELSTEAQVQRVRETLLSSA